MKKGTRQSLILILPAVILYTLVVAFPLINMTAVSFYEWNGVYGVPKVFVGLSNFIQFFQDKTIAIALKNILILMISSVIFIIPVSLFLACVINKEFFGLRLVKVSYFLPVIINKVSIGLLFTFIFYPKNGPFVKLITTLGYRGSMNVLGDINLAIWGCAFVLIWCNVGFYMILFSSSMASISEDIMEAALLDGADGRQTFLYVTLPLLKGTIGIGATLIMMNSFKVYDLIVALTGGGPGVATEVLSTYLFKNAFYYSRFGYADAIGVMMVVFSLIITILVNFFNREDKPDKKRGVVV